MTWFVEVAHITSGSETCEAHIQLLTETHNFFKMFFDSKIFYHILRTKADLFFE